jgi:membrane-associated phospholipid phosphatase
MLSAPDIAPYPTDRARPRLAASVTLVISAGLFGAVSVPVGQGKPISWDAAAQRVIVALGPARDLPLEVQPVVIGGAIIALVAFCTAALGLAVQRRMRELAFLSLAVGGMVALDPLLKAVFERPPATVDGSGYSFPSGTAMVSLAALGTLFVLLTSRRSKWSIAVLGVPVVIALGLAVVDDGWHYPSDVLGGWALAVAWVSALCLVPLLPPRHAATGTDRTAAGPHGPSSP